MSGDFVCAIVQRLAPCMRKCVCVHIFFSGARVTRSYPPPLRLFLCLACIIFVGYAFGICAVNLAVPHVFGSPNHPHSPFFGLSRGFPLFFFHHSPYILLSRFVHLFMVVVPSVCASPCFLFLFFFFFDDSLSLWWLCWASTRVTCLRECFRNTSSAIEPPSRKRKGDIIFCCRAWKYIHFCSRARLALAEIVV